MRDGKSFMNRDSSIDFFTDFPPILLTICYHIPTFFVSDIPKFSLNFLAEFRTFLNQFENLYLSRQRSFFWISDAKFSSNSTNLSYL